MYEDLRRMITEADRSLYIAVDFDGTLFEHKFPNIGKPNHQLIKLMRYAKKLGHKLILWTCREDEDRFYLQEAIQECYAYGIVFDDINDNSEWCRLSGFDHSKVRKIYADIYIDDKAYKV